MIQLRPCVLAAVALAIFFPAVASADVIVTFAHRETETCVYGGPDAPCVGSSDDGTAIYASTLSQVAVGLGAGTATQFSNVGTTVGGVTTFSATGGGTGTASDDVRGQWDFIAASGGSGYFLTFTLTEAYAYVLDGALSGVTTDLDEVTTAYHFTFQDDAQSSTPLVFASGVMNDADLLAQSGILGPGNYSIGTWAIGGAYSTLGNLGGTGAGTFSFDLALTPVAGQIATAPEPASMLLLGTGLLGAGLRRWRQKRT